MFKQRWPQIHVMRLIHATMGTRGLLHVGRFAVLCVVLALVSAGVWAQEPATSFDQLNLLLEKGDKITLVDPSGNKIAGRISRLAPDGLDLNVSGKAQTFSENNIRQITREKPDSPLNGFLIGAGIGFGATLPINLWIADSDEKGVAVFASALWGLIGGGIGALVDAFIHEKQLVYSRPKSNVSWNISPFYSDSLSNAQTPGARAFRADLPVNKRVKSPNGFRVIIRF